MSFKIFKDSICACLLLVVLVGTSTAVTASDTLRLGWQIPWATQGQLVMGLKHTNIPEMLDLNIEYIGFTYGGPLNRAALAKEVDVLLTADQPALVLMSRDPSFRIVARMMYNRVCIYVPPQSPVTELQQLSNKIVMGPVGAAAERVAMAAMSRSGVDLKSVSVGSLDMAQQSALLTRTKDPKTWPGVDALFGFDPLPAVFDEKGQARILNCGKVVSMVLASREMLETRRQELEAFLSAFVLSWHYFAQNPQAVNGLFSKESRLNVSDAVLDQAASIEPNRWVKSFDDLRLTFIDDDFSVLKDANDFLLERKIIKKRIDAKAYMELDSLKTALGRPDLKDMIQKIQLKN